MPKRKVAFLVLDQDQVVSAVVTRIRGRPELFDFATEKRFGATSAGSPNQDFVDAIQSLKSMDFDTLVLVTHGEAPRTVPPGDVQNYVQTDLNGPLETTHWYELALHLQEILDEHKALVAICCFSSQDEFRDSITTSLPGFTVACMGAISVCEAVQGTLTFFRETQTTDIDYIASSMPQEALDDLIERIAIASGGKMVGWVPH